MSRSWTGTLKRISTTDKSGPLIVEEVKGICTTLPQRTHRFRFFWNTPDGAIKFRETTPVKRLLEQQYSKEENRWFIRFVCLSGSIYELEVRRYETTS